MSASRDPRIYVQVLCYLREQISDGTLKPGSPTPTIGALTQRFSCARVTVRKAMKLLAQDGELILYPGTGYFVAPAHDAAASRMPV